MASASEIQEHLERYLLREISLDEFENWFSLATWNIHKTADQEGIDLAYSIEHQLALFPHHGDDLRRALLSFAPAQAENSYGPQDYATGNSYGSQGFNSAAA